MLSSRLQRLLEPMQRRNRKLPPQLKFMVVVLLAAAASGLYSTLARSRSVEQVGADTSETTRQAIAAETAEESKRALAQPVENAFEAARKGDLERYLSQFTNPLREQLNRTRTQQGEGYLRRYLTQLTGTIKGVAVDLTRKEEVGPDLVRIHVELIYADHNESQPFVMRQENGSWRISKIESLRSAPTLIPYGTPLEDVPTAR
ncbi:MAG: hypothetical protein JO316_22620 [Abitibacteriaceae bacterium]|nr:hypothetical protein [Abditibacteriaceae bacterium]MBV9868158.1 hypothetical protein [Abditibacteriaceae bacterium]